MALIIDTYNCIFAGSAMGGAMAELSVRKLCQFLLQAPHRQKTTLVIDGRPKPEEPGLNEFPELHLLYSGAGIQADDVIVEMVQRSGNRKHLTVVSNDREVQHAVRRLGATTQSCEAFLQGLLMARHVGAKLQKTQLPAIKKTGLTTKGETEQWLKEFGVGQPREEAKPKNREEMTDEEMKRLMGF